jgi:hypothetical protein
MGAQREPRTSDDLSAAEVLRPTKPPPSSGWRKWLYLASFRLINVGDSPRVSHRNSLAARVNRPLAGCYRIALLSLKGGVGKTTITATLGGTFASIRGDRVVAVDVNPDRGTLSAKVSAEGKEQLHLRCETPTASNATWTCAALYLAGTSRLKSYFRERSAVSLRSAPRITPAPLTSCNALQPGAHGLRHLGLMHSAMSAVLAKAECWS